MGGRLSLGEQRGAVIAEFALVFGILFLLLMLCLEVGLMVEAQLVLSSAAREGGRQAAVDGGWSTAVGDRIEEISAMGGLDVEELHINVQPNRAVYGRPIDVCLTYPYRIRTEMLRRVAPSVVDLRAEVVTRSERLDDD